MTEGTKYHELFEHLLFSGQGQLSMTFAEIEVVIGASLPPSARRREEWWSNNSSGHSQARAWLRANYRTSGVNLAGEKVTFTLDGWPEGYRRTKMLTHMPQAVPDGIGMSEAAQAQFEPSPEGEPPGSTGPQHPLFGIWKGKVTLLPGYDYAKPAFEPDAEL